MLTSPFNQQAAVFEDWGGVAVLAEGIALELVAAGEPDHGAFHLLLNSRRRLGCRGIDPTPVDASGGGGLWSP
jgi:hypothetical protein